MYTYDTLIALIDLIRPTMIDSIRPTMIDAMIDSIRPTTTTATADNFAVRRLRFYGSDNAMQ
jgi:hypothetical protein